MTEEEYDEIHVRLVKLERRIREAGDDTTRAEISAIRQLFEYLDPTKSA